MRSSMVTPIIVILMMACNSKKAADLLVFNATVYTLDTSFSKADAMVVKDGRILATGTITDLEQQYDPTQKLDANGQFIYPGFIDAHAHFVGYASNLHTLKLEGTRSWNDILERCQTFAQQLDSTEWLLGRGWDQNDWTNQQFPDRSELDRLFPHRPVYLVRVDGHAALVNAKALELAGIHPGDTVTGGSFEVKDGRLTGILVDNAMDKLSRVIPPVSTTRMRANLMQAQQDCFQMGLTTIHECGLDYEMVETLNAMHQDGSLQMKLYVFLSDHKKNYDYLAKKGTIKTDFLQVRGFKIFSDGALGSRGACLLEDYADRPQWKGFLLHNPDHFDAIAALIASHNWQMCTHAIGDSSNRLILKTYAKYLKGKNDLRWRIEHAQVVDKNDFHFFGDFNIVPSVQPTHATSDMYWAGARLGSDRLKSAYAFQQLLQQNQWIPLGTDFPVEDISPFKTFFAAVIRKDGQGYPTEGFQMENALTREQTLRGMTIWAAKAGFEEDQKGSLEPGKMADFILLNKDLMVAPETELLQVEVAATYVNGQKVFGKP